jgi:hypothetical protein
MPDEATPRRRRLIFPCAVLLAVAALLVPAFPRPPSAAMRARFDQIRDGMTEGEVGGLLGGPRGVYDEARAGPATTAAGTGSGGGHLSWWYFPGCTVEVGFDGGHRVNGKRMVLPPPQSLLGMAARWCGHTPGIASEG